MIHVLLTNHEGNANRNTNTNSNTIRSTSIKDIHVGDKVLTSTGNYETIYAIDHYHGTKNTNFIQIVHEKNSHNNHKHNHNKPLKLTEHHMLFLEGNDGNTILVAAKDVNVGDQVQTVSGPSMVTNTKRISREGVFNVLTNSGTIVANDVLASIYSAHYLGEKRTTTPKQPQ